MIIRWNEEEEKYLIEKWGQVDVQVLMKELGRTKDSIVRKAQRLELQSKKGENNSLRKKWSREEEAVLSEYYKVKPIKELLTLLPGRTREGIIKKAKLLGLNERSKHWSEEEIIYLEEKWGVIPIENIGRKLGRTKNAILLKAHKIGLREQVIANGEYLTPKDIASVLGVGIKTVYNWMDREYLRYRRLKINSIKRYQITIANLKVFLEEHEEKWDSRIADIKFINSCFLSCRDSKNVQRPEWLGKKIDSDRQKKLQSVRKQWTVKEEVFLKAMIDGGKTCKEIAKLLNRTFYSIQGKKEKIIDNRHRTEHITDTQVNQILRLG